MSITSKNLSNLGTSQAEFEAWEKLKSHIQTYRSHPEAYQPGSFKEHAVIWFRPQFAINALLHPGPAFFGYKEVLFAGLCTWVVCPQGQHLIQRSMLAEAVWQLDQTEGVARDNLPDPIFADLFARIYMIDRRFFEVVYNPLASQTPVDRLLQSSDSLSTIEQEVRNLDVAMSVLKIFHWHTSNLHERSEYLPPGLSRAYALVAKLGNELGVKNLSERRVIQAYKSFRASAPLAYAAWTIEAHKGESLLDLLLLQKATFEQHGHLLSEFFGRAAYVRDFLGHCAGLKDYNVARNYLGDIQAIPLPELTLSETAKAEIKGDFRRKARVR